MTWGFDDIQREQIRDDFPVLRQKVRGKPLIYFDNAATSQKPRSVIAALNDYYERYNANVHRGIHALAERATREYEHARERVVDFIHAESVRNVIFTRGTTESINLVAQAWARPQLKAGDEILTTYMEHHSNIVPWYQVAEQTGAVIKRLPLTDDGRLDLEHLEEHLTERTRLVAITHCSNMLGTINPIRQITAAAHQHGAVVVVDGAQSIPHWTVDVQDLGCDFFAFSGHKMCGPTGSGVLYGREELLDAMPPFMTGGEMISEVLFDKATYNELPYKFEAGTPSIADAIGLGHAIDYLQGVGLDNIRRHEEEITEYALQRLEEFVEVIIYGPRDIAARGGLVSFTFSDIHPHDLATFFDQHGIAIRAGHHCTMPLHKKLNLTATARASFYLYNTRDEVDVFIDVLRQAKKFFGPCPTARQMGF